MRQHAIGGSGRLLNPIRVAGWAGAVLLLCAPLIAMSFTRDVMWTPLDFTVFGAMLLLAGLGLELLLARGHSAVYRAGGGLAVATAFLLTWATIAVGFVGEPDHPANRLYAGVLAVGVVGALIARARPRGMATALLATAAAQMLAGLITLIPGTPLFAPDPAWKVVALNGLFATLFLASAGLFGWASRR